MMPESLTKTDVRLIEAGFPCHQVGAETQRERGASSALPPLYYLHVWWARRPLTPSRAAILGSLLPAGADGDWFLRQLGIEKVQALVNGQPWTLTGRLLDRVQVDDAGNEYLPVDATVLRAIEKEQKRRKKNLGVIERLCNADASLQNHPVIVRWIKESQLLSGPLPQAGEHIPVERVAADPAHVNERIEFRKSDRVKKSGVNFLWDDEDLYGYGRAYMRYPTLLENPITILDPTAGGGSIPFEGLRLGNKVIANDLNPVAAVILHATLKYPTQWGKELTTHIKYWGQKLIDVLDRELDFAYPNGFSLPKNERNILNKHLEKYPNLVREYDKEEIVDYLYARQVTCPHCGGEAPLLNTCWLSKQDGKKWGVKIVPDGRKNGGTVQFETYRVKGNKGPNGEDPEFSTVSNGIGRCIHCRQAISAEEIKSQARGESPNGKWKDRLYCVVAIRYQPKLDKDGHIQHYKSGAKKGQIKTEKIRFFRPPNERDLQALRDAEVRLQEKWDEWDRQGLIPTEKIPKGHKTLEPLRVGMNRWCDLFTPRQLLGHLTLIEELNRLKPEILQELGEEKGRAVVTYLQFMIDKGLDYNSKQTRWEYTRGIVKGTFGRHDFSLKWTFGEMIFTGSDSGAAWGLSQVVDAYKGMAELMMPVHEGLNGSAPPVVIKSGTAANTNLDEGSVDLVCVDPPYYNNVQYAELSDYFYVWQRRTLSDLYPDLFRRRMTNKTDEAVANPARDGSTANAAKTYERLMGEIFLECRRVIKDNGIMTIMFTHKTQEAWEALTLSLIENGWTITSSMPVESESAQSTHQMNMASAASSIFITCRKRETESDTPATWTGFGGTGVAQRVRDSVGKALKEFEPLHLNTVDEMVACYGRALQVLSEHWPVLDGDEQVSPIRAMNEASSVVAQHQIQRLTQGRLQVNSLSSEAAMALTFYGIFGIADFPYDEALNLSRSLNIHLENKNAGYHVKKQMIGINMESRGRSVRRNQEEEKGYHAPLLRKGSKLRLALPEERSSKRLENPQTEWDILQGLIMAYRQGDIPVARAYLAEHAEGQEQMVLDLLSVWSKEMAVESIRKEGEAILFGLK